MYVALMLHTNLESAMDQGKIVFVPENIETPSLTKWKCVVLNKKLLNTTWTANQYWRVSDHHYLGNMFR